MADQKVLALVDGQVQEVVVAAGGSASVPTFIATGTTFNVPAETQVLFAEEIELDGDLELDGVLVEVN